MKHEATGTCQLTVTGAGGTTCGHEGLVGTAQCATQPQQRAAPDITERNNALRRCVQQEKLKKGIKKSTAFFRQLVCDRSLPSLSMNTRLIGHDQYNCHGLEAKGQRSRCAGGVAGHPVCPCHRGCAGSVCQASTIYLSVSFSS